MNKIYYQVQFSRDGIDWIPAATGNKYNVTESLDEINTICNDTFSFLTQFYAEIKHFRIVKFIVDSEVVEQI